MRPVSRVIPLLAALLACRSAAPAAPPDTSAAAKQAIDAANATWPRLTSTGHADSIADLYAQTAIGLPPSLAPTRCPGATRESFATATTGAPAPTLHAASAG